MNDKLIARLIIDLAMTGLLLCAFAYRIIGDTAHEWIGILVFMFFIAHNIFNWQWYKNIFKGKYTPRRSIMAAVNIALMFTMATILVTGLLQSRTVLAFLHLPGGMELRLIHTTAAYWGLPLIGVHVGLHWGMIINGTRKIANITKENRTRSVVVRVLAFLFAAFGVWSSFDRDMFSKLFLGSSFDYWPEERPPILFCLAILSIMGIFILITHYVFKILVKYHKLKTHKKI
jgi:hypothetical protein